MAKRGRPPKPKPPPPVEFPEHLPLPDPVGPSKFDEKYVPDLQSRKSVVDNPVPLSVEVVPAAHEGASGHDLAALRLLVEERLRRKIEGLKLYEPMPVQKEFHASRARERIIRGSNRSGKTVGACAEVAWAITGTHPDTTRYPKENGIWYAVGKDGREVSEVIYRKLFRAGAFKIIRDLKTGEWRAFHPDRIEDLARLSEAKPAPPLVPPRMVKTIAWENRKENLPKLIQLTNGWEIQFFSSNALPPHGTDIDGAIFDEEIINGAWYSEIAARLVDRNGRFLWSATPQAGTEQLYELHERAEIQSRLPKEQRSIEEFVSLIDDNTHLTGAQKREFAEKLSDEERAVRVGGEFAIKHSRVFPEFTESIFVAEYFDIPRNWTRYIAVDPGRQVCAALFLALPPPEEPDFAYLYDELYIPNCTADMFGQKMAQKCSGQEFEAFLIDGQESQKHETGSGLTIEEMYSAALRKRKIKSHRTGSGFEWGAADPKAGVEACREWMRPRDNGLAPRLKLFRDKCPNFIEEVKRYRYKRLQGLMGVRGYSSISDEPESRGKVHLMATWRYLVQYNPRYVPPRKGKVRDNPVWAAAQKFKKETHRALNLGPGGMKMGAGA